MIKKACVPAERAAGRIEGIRAALRILIELQDSGHPKKADLARANERISRLCMQALRADDNAPFGREA
jgi:hypothetical protein